jgi:hypothetical protein
MKKQISVGKAIKRGKLVLLNWLLSYVVFMTIALFTLGKYPIWVFLTLFFSSMIFSSLITAFLINKWKYWAFGNVSNVHELKKRAVTARLISENDKFFENIGQSTNNDKKRDIKQKFLQNDIFVDDLSIPSETYIYHSKALIYFYFFITLFTIVGIVYLFTIDILVSGITALIVALTFRQLNRDKLKRVQPQIILNDKGIETVSAGFASWKNIKNEQVFVISAGKSTKYYLKYEVSERQESVLLTGLNIGDGKMAKLLILYRNRYEQKNKNCC